jgi:hypothetical protein
LPNNSQNASVSGRGEIVRDGAAKSPFLLAKYNHAEDAHVLQKGSLGSFVCEDEERAWQRHAKSRKSYSGAAHGAEYGEIIRELDSAVHLVPWQAASGVRDLLGLEGREQNGASC